MEVLEGGRDGFARGEKLGGKGRDEGRNFVQEDKGDESEWNEHMFCSVYRYRHFFFY
jgi:hypothetical protein